MAQRLEVEFEQEMRRIYGEAKQRYRYNATYFLGLLNSIGAMDAARQLAGEPGHHEGLTRLWELHGLDISVEAVVLRQPWRQLFDEAVLEQARKKLRALEYWEPAFDAQGAP